jgi:hypothetical protein
MKKGQANILAWFLTTEGGMVLMIVFVAVVVMIILGMTKTWDPAGIFFKA